MSKTKTKYIIRDWASNTLQFNGNFEFGYYSQELGVPMVFSSFSEARTYLDANFTEEEQQDLYTEET